MSTQPDPREGISRLLLLLAIPAEEKGLKQAAEACHVRFCGAPGPGSRNLVVLHKSQVESYPRVEAAFPCPERAAQESPGQRPGESRRSAEILLPSPERATETMAPVVVVSPFQG